MSKHFYMFCHLPLWKKPQRCVRLSSVEDGDDGATTSVWRAEGEPGIFPAVASRSSWWEHLSGSAEGRFNYNVAHMKQKERWSWMERNNWKPCLWWSSHLSAISSVNPYIVNINERFSHSRNGMKNTRQEIIFISDGLFVCFGENLSIWENFTAPTEHRTLLV